MDKIDAGYDSHGNLDVLIQSSSTSILLGEESLVSSPNFGIILDGSLNYKNLRRNKGKGLELNERGQECSKKMAIDKEVYAGEVMGGEVDDKWPNNIRMT